MIFKNRTADNGYQTTMFYALKIGAYFVNNNKFYHVSAPKVDVKDTIGAGDNFHAAFSFAIRKNLDIFEAVKFSVSVASLSCREYGGKNGIPNLVEAKNLSKKLFVRLID